MAEKQRVTEEQIAAAVKQWCGSWLKPRVLATCELCNGQYEPGYCEELDKLTVCKGCVHELKLKQ